MIRKLLFILFIPFYLSATIVKSNQISDLKQYIKSETLILLNIDTAVIDSAIFLGSEPWYDFLQAKTEELRKQYPEMDASFYYKLMLYVTRRIPLVGVEDGTASLIRSLQKKGHRILAFTGRGKDHLHCLPIAHYDQQTLDELRDVQVYFSKSSIPSNLKKHLEKGIIFAGDAEKGPFLKELLQKTNYFPKRIVFVSKLSHLQSVEASMKELGIDFVGIHYQRSRFEDNFDRLAALIQLQFLMDHENKGIIPTNEAAIILKGQFQGTADELAITLLLRFLANLKDNPNYWIE